MPLLLIRDIYATYKCGHAGSDDFFTERTATLRARTASLVCVVVHVVHTVCALLLQRLLAAVLGSWCAVGFTSRRLPEKTDTE